MSMDKIPTFDTLIAATHPKDKSDKEIFANTEIKNVLGFGSKSPTQNLKIWQKTNIKEEDRDISIRNKISEIKQNVRERHADLINKNSSFLNSASR